MPTFIIRSPTSQSSGYPIVVTRLCRPRTRCNPHLLMTYGIKLTDVVPFRTVKCSLLLLLLLLLLLCNLIEEKENEDLEIREYRK